MFVRLRCFFPLSFSGMHFFLKNSKAMAYYHVAAAVNGDVSWRSEGGLEEKRMVGGLPLKPGVIAVNCWVNPFESEDFGRHFSCGHLGRPNVSIF